MVPVALGSAGKGKEGVLAVSEQHKRDQQADALVVKIQKTKDPIKLKLDK
jgi:hypothetical protein